MRLCFWEETRSDIVTCPPKGTPFLVDSNGLSVTVPNTYLQYISQHRGRTRAPGTWELYGRHLYDYFSFLEANNLRFDQPIKPGHPSVVILYREWAVGRRSVGTVNDHLGSIQRFYVWCLNRKLVTDVPWDLDIVKVRARGGLLRHTYNTHRIRETSDIKFREFNEPITILDIKECVSLLDKLQKNPTHYRMAHFALATGVRVSELVSLPAEVVVNPASEVDGKMQFRITLDPDKMHIKYSKKRYIYVTYDTMRALYDYKMICRPVALRKAELRGEQPTALFLSPNGRAYGEKSFNMVLRRAAKKIGRHIYPHMLRHTFATHTLLALKNLRNEGFALAWVRDRLGHASIDTTIRYLHLLGDMHVDFLDQYQREIDVAININRKVGDAA